MKFNVVLIFTQKNTKSVWQVYSEIVSRFVSINFLCDLQELQFKYNLEAFPLGLNVEKFS
jgi:hypothetical protein